MWESSPDDPRAARALLEHAQSVLGQCSACGQEDLAVFPPEGRCQGCQALVAARRLCDGLHRGQWR